MSKTAATDMTRPAKERILDAAILRFSRQSYEATALRDIAADAQADVAYVHRAFGSKAALFQEVLRTTVFSDGFESVFSAPRSELPERLARHVLARPVMREPRDMGAFDIAMQSTASVEARAAVLEFVEHGFLEPLTRKLGHAEASRAVLITALLAGIDIMRSVMGAQSVTSLDQDWLEAAVAQMIRQASELEAPATRTAPFEGENGHVTETS